MFQINVKAYINTYWATINCDDDHEPLALAEPRRVPNNHRPESVVCQAPKILLLLLEHTPLNQPTEVTKYTFKKF